MGQLVNSQRAQPLRRNPSLRTQVIAWSFIPALVILAIVTALAFYTSWRITEDLVLERNREYTQLLAQQIGVGMTHYADLLDSVGRLQEVQSFQTAYQETVLRSTIGQLRVFDAGVVILDDSGIVVAVDGRRPDARGQDWSGRQYFRLVRSTESLVFASDILADGPQGSDVVAFVLPVRGDAMRFLGAIVGMFELHPQGHSAFYRSLLQSHVRSESAMYLVDGSGRIIDYHHPDRIGCDVSGHPAEQELLARATGALRARGLDGQVSIISYAPIPNTPWMLVTEENWAQLRRVSAGYGRLLIVLLVLGLLISPFVVNIGLRRVTTPIVELTAAAEDIAVGHLDQVITVPKNEELSRLAGAFNRMSAELRTLYGDLERKVEDRTRELSTLNTIANVVSRSLELEEILAAALAKTLEMLELEAGAAYCIGEDGKTLNLIAHHGLSRRAVAAARQLPLGVVANRDPMLPHGPRIRSVEEYPASQLRESLGREGWRSIITVPLVAKDEVVGVMSLRAHTPRRISPEERPLLAAIGQQIGMAVENALLYQRAEASATMAERTRLARELHDSVTQTLFSASLIAGVVPLVWEEDPREGARQLGELQQLTRGALAEMRTLLLELRPEALAGASLPDLLQQLAEAFGGRARIPVTLSIDGDKACFEQGPELKIAFYRITQEGLNNVAKHSGASQVRLTLRATDGEGQPARAPGEVAQIALSLCDDGIGFAPDRVSQDHLGLRIMHERAETVGASLAIESQPGRGTQIRLVWSRDQGLVEAELLRDE